MPNDTISQVEVNGTTYDLLDMNTLSAVSAIERRATALESSVGDIVNNVQSQVRKLTSIIPQDAFTADNTVKGAIDALTLAVDNISRTIAGFVTPEQFGAVGDGITDDTNALYDAFMSGMVVLCRPDAVYYTATGVTITNANNTYVLGNNCHITAPLDINDVPIIKITSSDNIYISNLNIHANVTVPVAQLNTQAPHGIEVDYGCTSIYIVGCTIHDVKDGISANRTNGMFVLQNNVYHVGQEPCGLRWNTNVICSNNAFHDHGGDGILVKAYEYDGYSNILITNNTLFDGAVRSEAGSGGGITCNAEFIPSGYPTRGVIIANNVITQCRYGVIVTNMEDCIIANNYSAPHSASSGESYPAGTASFGIATNPVDNPTNPNTNKNILFIGNVSYGGRVFFRTCLNVSTDVPVENITFIGNVGIPNPSIKSEIAIKCKNSTFIANDIRADGFRLADCYDCDFLNNNLSCENYSPSSPQTSDIYFRGDVSASIKGNILRINQVYINLLLGVFSENTIFINGVNNQPIKLATDSNNGHVIVSNNTINGQKIKAAQAYVSNPDRITVDWYQRTAIILNSDNSEIGYVQKDDRITYVKLDGPFVAGDFAHVANASFRPPEFKQLIVMTRDSNNQNLALGRCAFQTDGHFYMREYKYNSGSCIINAIYPTVLE